MLAELKQTSYSLVGPLVRETPHNLCVHAVIAGTCPGRICVDDSAAPRAALFDTPEGHFLVGNSQDYGFVRLLRDHVANVVWPRAKREHWEWLLLHYHPREWEPVLDGMFAGYDLRKDYQNFLLLARLRLEWRALVPEGFQMARIDETLLAHDKLKNHRRVAGWARNSFGSGEACLARGFGFCLLYEDAIVSWCLTDCVVGDRCEIGIHTDKDYRRRGFATATVAATVEHALARGVTWIGWHCWSGNAASAATAQKVGFEKVLEHAACFITPK